jgi:hypothetical protein
MVIAAGKRAATGIYGQQISFDQVAVCLRGLVPARRSTCRCQLTIAIDSIRPNWEPLPLCAYQHTARYSFVGLIEIHAGIAKAAC